MHGATAPQTVAAAERRKARAAAETAVATFGLTKDVDPADALLEEVHRTAGHVAWLEQRIHRMDADALVWGVTKRRAGRGPEGPVDVTDEAAEVSIWLQLYQQERGHLVKACSAALAAGAEERRVRLAEQQGAALAAVIRAVLDDLALTDDQRALVSDVVPRHLRAVTG